MPDRAVTDLLEAVRLRLGMDVAWLARVDADLAVVEALDGDGDSFGVGLGTTIRGAASYYPHIIAGSLPEVLRDIRGHAAAGALPATRALRAGAYATAPVFERDGARYGVLTAMSHRARPDLQERDRRFLRLVAEALTDSVSDLRRLWERRSAFWDRVSALIDAGGPTMVFQPIVDLRDCCRMVGVEALARFPDPPKFDVGECLDGQDVLAGGGVATGVTPERPGECPASEPERWFTAAAAVGLGSELELAAVRAAIVQLPRLPPGIFMSVNASPPTVGPDLLKLIGAIEPGRLLLEITEHQRIGEGSEVFQTVAELRARGVRIGADDVGSGYAGLAQLLALRPDLVKMDRQLTHGIDADPARRAVANALIQVADEIGASVLAEGIETAAELETLRATRVRFGQGNHLAPPSPLHSRG